MGSRTQHCIECVQTIDNPRRAQEPANKAVGLCSRPEQGGAPIGLLKSATARSVSMMQNKHSSASDTGGGKQRGRRLQLLGPRAAPVLIPGKSSEADALPRAQAPACRPLLPPPPLPADTPPPALTCRSRAVTPSVPHVGVPGGARGGAAQAGGGRPLRCRCLGGPGVGGGPRAVSRWAGCGAWWRLQVWCSDGCSLPGCV